MGRAVAAVDPLDLARDQAVDDIAHAGAAVALRQRGAEQAELAEFGHDLPVEALVAERLQHPGLQPVPAILPRGLLDHALVLAELAVEQERIVPLERRMGRSAEPWRSGGAAGRCSWQARLREGGPEGMRPFGMARLAERLGFSGCPGKGPGGAATAASRTASPPVRYSSLTRAMINPALGNHRPYQSISAYRPWLSRSALRPGRCRLSSLAAGSRYRP